jgi:Icc-related predicted phosphoesterase
MLLFKKLYKNILLFAPMPNYKKIKFLFIFFFIIFSVFFIHASIEYFDLQGFRPINQISMEKLEKINFTKSNIKVAVIGDTKEGLQVFCKLVRKAKREGCQFIIHTGDIIRFNDLRIYHYVYNEVRELIDEYDIPIFVLPGNHDTWSHHKYSNKNFRKFFGNLPLMFEIKNSAFVLINDSNYKIDNNSVERIDKYLKSKKFKYKFLFAHVPTRDPRKNSNHCIKNNEEAHKIENLIENNQFTMAFFSHIHSYLAYKINNTPCYISGGGGASLFDGNYHFLSLTINKNQQLLVKKENICWLYGLNLADYLKMRSMEWLPFKRK